MLKKDIYRVTRDYLDSLGSLHGKTVVDVPAGNGHMSSEFTRLGARVIALDLLPENITGQAEQKIYADMNDGLPIADEVADIVLCQEGIEHISDQIRLIEECNRVLKVGGLLIITSPSLSHIRARISMLLVESEYWKRLPASEVDSIWFSETHSNRIYFGHFFLLTANQLRLLVRLSGFSIRQRLRTSISVSSLVLFLLFYPFIFSATFMALADSFRKNRQKWSEEKTRAYREQVTLNLSPITLLSKDFFWVVEKMEPLNSAREKLKQLTR